MAAFGQIKAPSGTAIMPILHSISSGMAHERSDQFCLSDRSSMAPTSPTADLSLPVRPARLQLYYSARVAADSRPASTQPADPAPTIT